MKKVNVAIVILSILLGLSPSFGDWLEEIKFDAPKNKEYEVSVLGFFSKSGSAHPGDVMFEYVSANKKFKLKGYFYFTSYTFLGRTGEKTFEIEKKERTGTTDMSEEVKKLSIYFDKAGSSSELRIIPPVYTECTKDYKIYLKMINLRANELEYQIILPKCLEGKK